MKRILLIAMFFLAAAGFAAAQIAAPSTDVLGAHLNYGRGCVGCHTPHSGALGNGITPKTGTDTGSVALWGEDPSPLFGQAYSFGATKYLETLPASLTTGAPDVMDILLCLSCHDGNLAKSAMMKNSTYETLPSYMGTNAHAPTLIGNNGLSGAGAASYLTDHPVGPNATIGCGGSYNWDCSLSATGAIQPGPKMTNFINNYGFFVKPQTINNLPAVMCTTCHNQHLMNTVYVTNKPFSYTTGSVAVSGTQTGLPTGSYTTMFFVLAPYNPASGTTGSNQTAQFCRQCHGGESNEMNGGTSGTIF